MKLTSTLPRVAFEYGQTSCASLTSFSTAARSMPGTDTAIATAAIANVLAGEEAFRNCRKPEILAETAYRVLTKPAADFTGHFLIDDTFLAGEGVTDFEKYRAMPGEPLAGPVARLIMSI